MEQRKIYSDTNQIVNEELLGAKLYGVKFQKILGEGSFGIVVSCKLKDHAEFLKGAFVTKLEAGRNIVAKILFCN